jgi:hypothetical protein
MFKKLKYLSFSLVLVNFCQAQEESLFDRINGISFANNIFINWQVTEQAPKGALYYRIDSEDDWHLIDEELMFKVRNNHQNNFKIYREFYNPLNFAIKSGVRDLDDPSYIAINQFISQLPVSGSTQTSFSPTPTSFALKAGTSTPLVQSMLLHQWILEFSLVIDNSVVTASHKNGIELNNLITEINKIKAADDYLFNKFRVNVPTVTESNTVTGWISGYSYKLFAVTQGYSTFETLLATTRLIHGELYPLKLSSRESVKTIEKILTTDYASRLDKFVAAAYKDTFKKYSASTAAWLSLSHNDRFDLNDKAIDKFDSFLKGLESHIKRFTKKVCDAKGNNCNQYALDYDLKLTRKTKIMKSFEYGVVTLDKDGTEIKDNNFKANFIVGKRPYFYPYVSTGVLYTDFSYPDYAIATDGSGNNIVARVGDIKVGVRPAVFLNHILRSWDPVYPFLQIGVTTSMNDALFPIGGGFSFGSTFSVSGGLLLGYVKDLNELSVDGPVADDAALKNDLTNKGVANWYFSINYNLSKK